MSRETRRLQIQTILEEVLGSKNVYFQPPASISMKYPCIVYGYDNDSSVHADSVRYLVRDRYSVTLITKDAYPSAILEELESLPYCAFSRKYSSDNLNHFSFNLVFSERTFNV